MMQHFIVSTVGPYIFKGYKILKYKFIGVNFIKQLSDTCSTQLITDESCIFSLQLLS